MIHNVPCQLIWIAGIAALIFCFLLTVGLLFFIKETMVMDSEARRKKRKVRLIMVYSLMGFPEYYLSQIV